MILHQLQLLFNAKFVVHFRTPPYLTPCSVTGRVMVDESQNVCKEALGEPGAVVARDLSVGTESSQGNLC
jgi:hypothetical protein